MEVGGRTKTTGFYPLTMNGKVGNLEQRYKGFRPHIAEHPNHGKVQRELQNNNVPSVETKNWTDRKQVPA